MKPKFELFTDIEFTLRFQKSKLSKIIQSSGQENSKTIYLKENTEIAEIIKKCNIEKVSLGLIAEGNANQIIAIINPWEMQYKKQDPLIKVCPAFFDYEPELRKDKFYTEYCLIISSSSISKEKFREEHGGNCLFREI